jgi:16S rRNA (guanine966-N2)-methyltransferase
MPELRITGGDLGGRRIRSPGSKELRPTTERVREALFSILGDVSGARVLDLFCGTGALGIEAISRGAAEATLVDRRPQAARRNVEDLGLGEHVQVVGGDAARFLRRAEPRSYDLVLCDPPYRIADRLAADLGPLIEAALAKSGRVVIESSPDHPMQIELPLLTERTYGDTMVRIHLAD